MFAVIVYLFPHRLLRDNSMAGPGLGGHQGFGSEGRSPTLRRSQMHKRAIAVMWSVLCYGNREEGHPAWVGVCVQEGFLAEVSLDLGVEAQVCTYQPGSEGGGVPGHSGRGNS